MGILVIQWVEPPVPCFGEPSLDTRMWQFTPIMPPCLFCRMFTAMFTIRYTRYHWQIMHLELELVSLSTWTASYKPWRKPGWWNPPCNPTSWSSSISKVWPQAMSKSGSCEPICQQRVRPASWLVTPLQQLGMVRGCRMSEHLNGTRCGDEPNHLKQFDSTKVWHEIGIGQYHIQPQMSLVLYQSLITKEPRLKLLDILIVRSASTGTGVSPRNYSLDSEAAM